MGVGEEVRIWAGYMRRVGVAEAGTPAEPDAKGRRLLAPAGLAPAEAVDKAAILLGARCLRLFGAAG